MNSEQVEMKDGLRSPFLEDVRGTPAILFDVQMGVAGDMFLGALIDLALPEYAIKSDLLPILERAAASLCEVEVTMDREMVNGIMATGVSVIEKGCGRRKEHMRGAEMSEHLSEGLNALSLGDRAKRYAVSVLEGILRAEGVVHGSSLAQLHLHETGAPDTLVEIIGSAYLLESAGVFSNAEVHATPISVGSGQVRISHGRVPVPAPATLELLKGMPFKFGPVKGELATPTGVSLLKGLRPKFIEDPCVKPFVPRGIGYGFGKRKYDGKYLNVVRAVFGSVG